MPGRVRTHARIVLGAQPIARQRRRRQLAGRVEQPVLVDAQRLVGVLLVLHVLLRRALGQHFQNQCRNRQLPELVGEFALVAAAESHQQVGCQHGSAIAAAIVQRYIRCHEAPVAVAGAQSPLQIAEQRHVRRALPRAVFHDVALLIDADRRHWPVAVELRLARWALLQRANRRGRAPRRAGALDHRGHAWTIPCGRPS